MTSEALSPQISNFEDFLALLNVPKACQLKKPIFKKMFLEASDGKKSILDAADKKALKDNVEKIRWLYTLKPNTINIAHYKDQEREYPEIAILHVELSNPDKHKRIAQFINRAIPYPLLLLFTYSIEGQEKLSIVLSDKRINQADKEKWVIEDSISTHWINLSSISAVENEFLVSLNVSNLPFSNFFAFYQALIERAIAIKCAEHSGEFSLDCGAATTENSTEALSGTTRLDKLRDLDNLESRRSEMMNKLKKVKQMGKQIELNTQIKNINDRIAKIKGSL